LRKGTEPAYVCYTLLHDSPLTPSQLQRADEIVTKLGGGADAVAAAIGMVTAEKNTNPSANNNVQNVCGDPSLPATAELRGITPLIDPAVDVNGAAAALSKSSAAAPLAAAGMSVFDLMNAAGLGDLVVSQAAGGNAAAGGAAGGNAGGNNQQANNNQGNNQNQGQANNNQNQGQANNNAGNNQQNQNAGNNNNQNAAGNNNNQNAAGNNNNNQNVGNANQGAANNSTGAGAAAGGAAGGAAAGGADFGKCTPTIIFEAGQNGRAATEFTFQIADKLARGGQQDALNPNIITKALCNQLTNVCGANAAAVTTCKDAAAKVEAAGTRDKSTADLFNSAIGFAGAVTNPDGGPADKPAAAAGNARKMRRGLRL
jgi:hypothetical protein